MILITGQYAAGNDPEWRAIAQAGLPIIIYMGMGRLAEITAALITAGVSPETPTAVVCEATTPRQRALVTSLQRVATDAAAQGLGSPSIVAIGEMVRLRAALTPFALTL